MKEQWINVAKCAAIMAVMLDHVRFRLYTDATVQNFSFYSVSLFILLMGITTYISYSRSAIALGKKVLIRIKSIIVPYFWAVVIYSVVINHYFDLVSVLHSFINFNIVGPHYYVLLYVQMLLVTPLIFVFVRWCVNNEKKSFGLIAEIVFGGGVLLIATLMNNYSSLLNTTAINVKLFGGSYLVLLYLGMIISAHKNFFENMQRKWLVVLMCFSLVLAIMIQQTVNTHGYVLDKKLPLGSSVNPPGIMLIAYAICILTVIYCMVKLIEGSKVLILSKLIGCLDFFGRHTLYIFLYHRLFLNYFIKDIDNIVVNWIFYFGIMIGGSLLLEFAIKKIEKYMLYCYGVKNL